MATSHVLSKSERQIFNSPPVFTSEGRKYYFTITEETMTVINKMHSKTNKISFVLLLGYFKCANRFFMPASFHKKDIVFVENLLNFKDDKFSPSQYNDRTFLNQQKTILSMQGVAPFDAVTKKTFLAEIDRLVAKQMRPKIIIIKLCELLKNQKIEVPSYNQFFDSIVHSQQQFEDRLIETLETSLSDEHKLLLDALLPDNSRRNISLQRSPLTKLKNILLSTRPQKIKENVNQFLEIKELFEKTKSSIEALQLSSDALKYYAKWINKARVLQLAEWKDPFKRYLYLLAFISHQYYQRQDLLVDILLKAVRSAINTVKQKQKTLAAETKKEKDLTTQRLSASYSEKRNVLKKIREIIFSAQLANKQKIELIRNLLVDGNVSMKLEQEDEFITLIDKQLTQSLMGMDYYELLEKSSIKLQNRVSFMLKHIDFNPATSDIHIIEAIDYFKKRDGDLGANPPLKFLNKDQADIVLNESGKLRTSLYKALLFINIADGVKSGTVNLTYSYHYLSLDEYMLPKKQWELNREEWIKQAGIWHLQDFRAVIKPLKLALHTQYCKTNERINAGENLHITFNKQGKVIVKTPKVEKSNNKRVADLLPKNKYISILDVLTDIDQYANYSDCFQHYRIRDKKKRPLALLIYAGLLSKGCNIGTNKLANTSKGISEDVLENIINWYFSNDNILAANNRIIQLANKLALPELLKRSLVQLHTSSDGKKRGVNVDSLIAEQSYKYFGSDKGVSIYDFIDERHLLFHLKVISSTEREAHYVVDGLLNNDVIKSDIHSTDTHGYTDLIFAVMHLLGTSFAPRLAKIKDRLLYSFKKKKFYENKGYKILPNKYINIKLLGSQWDEVLRFMVSIKLKEVTAFQIFKRLSSYSKDHPLYKALKELGKITKTLFLLTYMDDIELRQAIQKQLNKIELSNKFSDAVFFANNQEFQQGTQDEQETAMNCRMLIQNAIVVWNYLYLSQEIVDCDDVQKKDEILSIAKNSSMMNWGHINFSGEYDFREKTSSNGSAFDINKILELELVA